MQYSYTHITYCWYSGYCLYSSKRWTHSAWLKGGRSLIKCQSTIDSPDSVRRVTPPKATAPKVMPAHANIHLATAFRALSLNPSVRGSTISVDLVDRPVFRNAFHGLLPFKKADWREMTDDNRESIDIVEKMHWKRSELMKNLKLMLISNMNILVWSLNTELVQNY